MRTSDQMNQHIIETFGLNLSDVDIKVEKINRGMGYPTGGTPEYISDIVMKYLERVDDHLSLMCGYKIIPDADLKISKQTMSIKGCEFNIDKIIGAHIRKAEEIIIFVATAGIKFDKWIFELYKSGHQLDAYVVDTIGSEVVESAGDWLETYLQNLYSVKGFKCSNRLSPGYCNWNVSEQHKLFSFLPEGFCGIKLNDSALMTPIKSISGIIGAGREVKRLDYQCQICDLQNCYKRRREFL
ncbi:MAG: hypothetical protein JW995_15955 [Melioribacteraceae bacterium]|nr:hypothetical protein [Melioribacteraceae bacterium]